MSKRDDAELVRRLRAGDASAWDAIDRRHRPALERFARRMLRDVAPDQVEDVVQEALWRAHRALHRDTRVLELRPWLYRLTRNCCLDERARVRTDAVELERAAGLADRADGPAATVERRGALRTLLDDLARLPELQRHALLRRELDGLSHDELAAELGLTPGATRSLVHRARGALTRAAEGRTLGCEDVRPDILDAYDGRRRPTARTLRHLASCPSLPRAPVRAALAAPQARRAGAAGRAAGRARRRLARRLAREGGDDRDDRGGRRRRLRRALPGGRPGADDVDLDRRSRTSGSPPARRSPRASRSSGTRSAIPEQRDVALSCPPGLRLADLLPPEGGRVSAHYDATTTIGADQTGRVVLTGAGPASPSRSPRCAADPTRTGRSWIPPTPLRVKPGELDA